MRTNIKNPLTGQLVNFGDGKRTLQTNFLGEGLPSWLATQAESSTYSPPSAGGPGRMRLQCAVGAGESAQLFTTGNARFRLDQYLALSLTVTMSLDVGVPSIDRWGFGFADADRNNGFRFEQRPVSGYDNAMIRLMPDNSAQTTVLYHFYPPNDRGQMTRSRTLQLLYVRLPVPTVFVLAGGEIVGYFETLYPDGSPRIDPTALLSASAYVVNGGGSAQVLLRVDHFQIDAWTR